MISDLCRGNTNDSILEQNMRKYYKRIVVILLLVMINICEADFMKELKKKSKDSNWKIMLYFQYNLNYKKELHLLDGTLTDSKKELYLLDGTLTDSNIVYDDIYNLQTKHRIEFFLKITDKDANRPTEWVRFCDQYGKVVKEFSLDPNYHHSKLLAVAPDESELIFRTTICIIKFDTRTLKTERFDIGGLKIETIEYSNDKSYILVGGVGYSMCIYEQSTGKIIPLGTGYFPRWNAGYDGVIYTKNGNPFYRIKEGAFEKNIKTLEEKHVPFYPEAYSPDREYYLHYKFSFWSGWMSERINVYLSPSKATDKKNAVYIGGPFPFPRPNGCVWMAE